jgi:hypothetical protein
MKQKIAIVAAIMMFLIVISFAQSATKTKSKSTDKSSAMGASSTLQSALEAKEKALWEGFKNKDTKPFADLATDSIEVTPQGPIDRAGTLSSISGSKCDIKSVSLDSFKLTKVDRDAVVLTYKGKAEGTCEGQAPPTAYCSTLWVKRGSKWLALFHQETNVQQ